MGRQLVKIDGQLCWDRMERGVPHAGLHIIAAELGEWLPHLVCAEAGAEACNGMAHGVEVAQDCLVVHALHSRTAFGWQTYAATDRRLTFALRLTDIC